MDVTCPSCHRNAIPGDRFCAGCGAPVPAARRTIASDEIHPLPAPAAPRPRRLEFRGGMLLLAVIGLTMFGGLTALAYAVIDLAGEPAASISATAPDTDTGAASAGQPPIAVAELRPGANAVSHGVEATMPSRLAMAGGTTRGATVMPRYAIIPGGAIASAEMTFVAGMATTPLPSVDAASIGHRHPADGTGGPVYHPGT